MLAFSLEKKSSFLKWGVSGLMAWACLGLLACKNNSVLSQDQSLSYEDLGFDAISEEDYKKVIENVRGMKISSYFSQIVSNTSDEQFTVAGRTFRNGRSQLKELVPFYAKLEAKYGTVGNYWKVTKAKPARKLNRAKFDEIVGVLHEFNANPEKLSKLLRVNPTESQSLALDDTTDETGLSLVNCTALNTASDFFDGIGESVDLVSPVGDYTLGKIPIMKDVYSAATGVLTGISSAGQKYTKFLGERNGKCPKKPVPNEKSIDGFCRPDGRPAFDGAKCDDGYGNVEDEQLNHMFGNSKEDKINYVDPAKEYDKQNK